METYTDPAREIVDLCDKLNEFSNERGASFLANKFGVKAWSAEFFEILSAICTRFDDLEKIISSLDLDEDIGQAAVSHLESLRYAFLEAGLINEWRHSVENFLSPIHVGPIRTLSGQVRGVCRYPKLDTDTTKEVLDQIDALVERLEQLQLSDQDFIRQSLVDGLKRFRFRLKHMSWVGRGYVLTSLKEVISAYVMMETGFPDQEAAPDAHAILKITKAALVQIYNKLKLGKDAFETVGWTLKMYGATSLYFQTQHGIAGLLPKLFQG